MLIRSVPVSLSIGHVLLNATYVCEFFATGSISTRSARCGKRVWASQYAS